MGFRINTNIAAMGAHTNGVMNNRNLDESLSKLSSGLRINKAADDASGMVIANSLRNQANSLGQAIANGNDAIGLVQTADGALNEYSKILDTIKTKAIQAGSDTQNTTSRLAIQKDIGRLMEELGMIAKTTSFNGQKLLSGSFTNKAIQMGASSNETINFSVASAETSKLGHTSRADLSVSSVGDVQLTMKSALTGENVTMKSVNIQYNNSPINGMGALADEINSHSGMTGIRAKATVEATTGSAIKAGTTTDFAINGISIGNIQVSAGDTDGALLSAINAKTTQTGVAATMEPDGKMTLKSTDGRAIQVTGDVSTIMGATSNQMSTLGKIELVQKGAAEFKITGIGAGATGAAITISGDMTTTKDSTLAAGSIIAQGSELKAGSVIGGDARLTASMTTTQLDMSVKAGSTIGYGSTLAAGTVTGGSFIVGGDKATSTALDQDMLLTSGSTIKGGSTIGKGTVITTQFTDNAITYNVGDILIANLTLQAATDITLTADMVLKDGTTGDSSLKVGSIVNSGSQLGANFTVGIQYDQDNLGATANFAAGTPSTNDRIVDVAITQAAAAANTITLKAGSLLKAGSTINLDILAGPIYNGPSLVTTLGVIKTGDATYPNGTAFTAGTDISVTLTEDAYIAADYVTGSNAAATSIAVGSILMAGTIFTNTAPAAGSYDIIDNKDNMIVSSDMTLKSGSSLNGGSILIAGSTVGDSAYVAGATGNSALTTYLSTDLKAGSVLQNGSVLGEGSTIGGQLITAGAPTTLTSDMMVKAGSTLKYEAGINNTMLKAGTVMTQDVTLNTASTYNVNTEVKIKAGDVLTQDLYVGADTTISSDMLLKEGSKLAALTSLSVNTENSGSVGLSAGSVTNLSGISVLTAEDATKAIDTLDAAITDLDTIRADLGSVQNQVIATINNISVTQVNVKAAESQLRDVDFAAESANFSKYNILAQSGSYAMSQANAVQQNVLKLLQ